MVAKLTELADRIMFLPEAGVVCMVAIMVDGLIPFQPFASARGSRNWARQPILDCFKEAILP
jgi:hypothetical protein